MQKAVGGQGKAVKRGEQPGVSAWWCWNVDGCRHSQYTHTTHTVHTRKSESFNGDRLVNDVLVRCLERERMTTDVDRFDHRSVAHLLLLLPERVLIILVLLLTQREDPAEAAMQCFAPGGDSE